MLSLPPILCFHSLWIGKEESNNYAALQYKIINWPHSKWRPSGFYGFENMGVVLDSVYFVISPCVNSTQNMLTNSPFSGTQKYVKHKMASCMAFVGAFGLPPKRVFHRIQCILTSFFNTWYFNIR